MSAINKIILLGVVLISLYGCKSTSYKNSAKIQNIQWCDAPCCISEDSTPRLIYTDTINNKQFKFFVCSMPFNGPYTKLEEKALREFHIKEPSDILLSENVIREALPNLRRYSKIVALDTLSTSSSVIEGKTDFYFKNIYKKRYHSIDCIYFIDKAPISKIHTYELFTSKDTSKNSSDDIGVNTPYFVYFSSWRQYYTVMCAIRDFQLNTKAEGVISKRDKNSDISIFNKLSKMKLKTIRLSKVLPIYIFDNMNNEDEVIMNDNIKKKLQISPLDTVVYKDGAETFIVDRLSPINTDSFWKINASSEFIMPGNNYDKESELYINFINNKVKKQLIMECLFCVNDRQISIIQVWKQGKNGNIDYNPIAVENHLKLWGRMDSIMSIARYNVLQIESGK